MGRRERWGERRGVQRGKAADAVAAWGRGMRYALKGGSFFCGRVFFAVRVRFLLRWFAA